MIKRVFIGFLVLAGLWGCFYLGQQNGAVTNTDVVYLNSFELFNKFQMKLDYDQRLMFEISDDKKAIDSLGQQLAKTQDVSKLALYKVRFEELKRAFDGRYQELSSKYTTEVYKRLNGFIDQYCKKHHYQVVLGNSGAGNVMYVDPSRDITKSLLQYCNKEYKR